MRSLALFAAGCVPIGPGSATPLFLALGAEVAVQPDALCASCFDEIDQIRDVVVEVPGVVEVVEIGPATVTLAGKARGTSLVSISGLDDGTNFVERYVEVTVDPVIHFDLGPRCDPFEPSEDPFLVPVGAELEAYWFMYSSDYVALVGDPSFDFGLLLAQSTDVDNQLVQLLADEIGVSEVTSPLWNGPLATIEVFDPATAYDGIAFEEVFSGPVTLEPGGGAMLVRSVMLVRGEPVCLDEEDRLVEALTPDICGVGGRDVSSAATSGTLLTVFGRAPGVCAVQVTALDYGFTDTYEVEFVRP